MDKKTTGEMKMKREITFVQLVAIVAGFITGTCMAAIFDSSSLANLMWLYLPILLYLFGKKVEDK